ncbi:hypothetical protein ACJX0J_021300, partial [Zea mays]
SWEVGGFFYHEYINKKTLFFASNINQFDLYSSLVDNFSLEISKADHILNKMNATKWGNKKRLKHRRSDRRLLKTAAKKDQGIDQLLPLLLKKIMFSLLDNLILLEEKNTLDECFGCYLLTIAILDLSNV